MIDSRLIHANPKHYVIYDGKTGEKFSSLNPIYERIIKESTALVLIGEVHDDSIAHDLEMELFQNIHALYKVNEEEEKQENLQEIPKLEEDKTAFWGMDTRENDERVIKNTLMRRQTLSKLHNRKQVALSLEMFERDVQCVLDEYLLGLIRERDFLKDSRPWSNYKDYRPLVEYAKEEGIDVIAANAPRRYVSLVGRFGSDSLRYLPTESLLRYLPSLPYPSSSMEYQRKFYSFMTGLSADTLQQQEPEVNQREARDAIKSKTKNIDNSEDGGGCPHVGLGMEDLKGLMRPMALWDSTMADSIVSFFEGYYDDNNQNHLNANEKENETSISTLMNTVYSANGKSNSISDAVLQSLPLENLKQDSPSGKLLIHICGKFHVESFLGIIDVLNHFESQTTKKYPRIVITICPTDNIDHFDKEEHMGLGDYVILTDETVDR